MTPKVVPFETPDWRPESVVKDDAPGWTRSSAVAVIITSAIGITGILGGEWIAHLLGVFIGWAAVFAVIIIGFELWALSRFMDRVRARWAAREIETPEKPVRRAA